MFIWCCAVFTFFLNLICKSRYFFFLMVQGSLKYNQSWLIALRDFTRQVSPSSILKRHSETNLCQRHWAPYSHPQGLREVMVDVVMERTFCTVKVVDPPPFPLPFPSSGSACVCWRSYMLHSHWLCSIGIHQNIINVRRNHSPRGLKSFGLKKSLIMGLNENSGLVPL